MKCGNEGHTASKGKGWNSHSEALCLPFLPALPPSGALDRQDATCTQACRRCPARKAVLIWVLHISSLPRPPREVGKGGNGVHTSDLCNLLAALVKRSGDQEVEINDLDDKFLLLAVLASSQN